MKKIYYYLAAFLIFAALVIGANKGGPESIVFILAIILHIITVIDRIGRDWR